MLSTAAQGKGFALDSFGTAVLADTRVPRAEGDRFGRIGPPAVMFTMECLIWTLRWL